MNTRHIRKQSHDVEEAAALVVDGDETPAIEMYASDLTGQHAVDELIAHLAALEGVQQVRRDPSGRPIHITYDPALTDGDALVRHARTWGYGVCIITTRFDLHDGGARVCLGSIKVALQHTHGVLTVTGDRLTKQITVSYMPGPTDMTHLRDMIATLTHNHVRALRQRRFRHGRRYAVGAFHQ